jgi:hypothetical protein
VLRLGAFTLVLALALVLAAPAGASGGGSSRSTSGRSGWGRGRAWSRGWGNGGGYGGGWAPGWNLGPGPALAPYPFAPGARGTHDAADDAPQRTTLQLHLEGGWVAYTIGRAAIGLRVMFPHRLELGIGYQAYLEWRSDGSNEAIALGRASLAVRLVEDDDLHLRIGFGGRHVQDALGAVFGVDGSLGLEIFTGGAVIALDGAVGFVGGAALTESRLTFGGMLERLEMYVGGSLVTLTPFSGGTTVLLGGAFVGFRFWAG